MKARKNKNFLLYMCIYIYIVLFSFFKNITTVHKKKTGAIDIGNSGGGGGVGDGEK